MGIDPRLSRKAARGLQGNELGTADPVKVFLEALQHGIVPVYITNAMASGTFGVHPHGWWRGGDVSYNPNTAATLSQTNVTQGGSVNTDAAGDVTLYTVTTGVDLYATYIRLQTAGTTVITYILTDGTANGGTERARGVFTSATAYGEIHEHKWGQVPALFATGIRFESGYSAATTIPFTFAGWEE